MSRHVKGVRLDDADLAALDRIVSRHSLRDHSEAIRYSIHVLDNAPRKAIL